MTTYTRTCLTVAALRRSIVYQPLTVLTVILMLPLSSWMVGGDQTGPFQVRAQAVQGCASTTNSIIQNYCTPAVGNQGGTIFYPDLVQLEGDAVNAYLAAHNLPATDAHVIYDYGRADLRNAIRGNIISILLGVIATPASKRTTHQQALYRWLQNLVWGNEIADYTDSYNEFLKWQGDPCHYTLDPQIASQYGIAYNGQPYCGVTLSQVFNAEIPAPSYFKAVGQKNSYQAWADKLTCPINASGLQDKSCKTAFQESTINMAEVAGIATAAGGIIVAPASTVLAASLYSAISAYTGGLGAAANAEADLSALWIVSGSTVADIGGAALAFAGPIITVILAIGVGVEAGVEAFNYQQSVNDLNDLKNQVTAVTNAPPDLNGMATDTTGLGLFKIENTVMPQTLKTNADGTMVDLPSTAPLPTHRLGTDLEFESKDEGPTSSTLSFKGWNGEIWSAQTWGGWFVQTCANGTKIDNQADGTCIQADSISGDLHYIDSRFEQYVNGLQGSPGLPSWLSWLSDGTPAFSLFALSRFSAARFVDKFVATRAGGKISPIDLNTCPVFPAQSYSLDSDGSCWSYFDRYIPMVAADGSNTFAILTSALSPTFTSSSAMAFGPSVPNIPQKQTITVVGDPTPAVCIVSSNLPPNFTINGSPSYAWMGTNDCSNSSGVGGLGTVGVQLAFDGSATPQPTYFLELKAVNNIGGANIHAVTQTFTINVTPKLSIVSPGTMNVTSGVPANFTVVATGVPTPTLSVDGVDLGGMKFTDNGNGTATISGIDSNTIDITSCLVSVVPEIPCGIVATNSQGTYRQPFLINLTTPPTAHLVCNQTCSTTFYAGAPNQVLLTSSGATTPVSWPFPDGFFPVPPSWLSLHDNLDGTAVLSGTPPAGTVGAFNFSLLPSAKYTNPGAVDYTINVVDNAVFTSPNSTTSDANSSTGSGGTPLAAHVMIAGSAAASNSFTVTANTGTISLSTLLPQGLTFDPSGNSAIISGSPAAGTGGQYLLRLSDDGGTAGTAAQQLVLNVNEAPAITSNGTASMFVGTPGSFALTTTGFPAVSTHAISPNPQPPTDPSQGSGMYFTVTGLPADLFASNLNPAGFATGTLTIQGTPSAADIGTHQVQITAENGVGTAAQQTLTLNIVGITGPAPASGTTCNGNYNGTFKGSIRVSAGQNCAFYSGGVTGTVSVNGGSLALTNATVTGNMSIQGGSAFSIGPGTTISGNLSIDGVASGSSTSRICQAKVGGNLQVHTDAIPIAIGSPQTFCYGNSFGGNVNIQGNTAAIDFYDNTVAKNLSCSSNSSIAGSGDSAGKKTGQCSRF